MKDIPAEDRERIREELALVEFRREMNAEGIAVVEAILREHEKNGGGRGAGDLPLGE